MLYLARDEVGLIHGWYQRRRWIVEVDMVNTNVLTALIHIAATILNANMRQNMDRDYLRFLTFLGQMCWSTRSHIYIYNDDVRTLSILLVFLHRDQVKICCNYYV